MKFFYNGFSKTPCIYEIKNVYSDRVYVGQTKEPKNRWIRGHKQSLQSNKHRNEFLQNDFNKCLEMLGHTDFLEFHIIEPLPDSSQEQRDQREQYWISERSKIAKLYNMTKGGQGNNIVGDETKTKISKIKKAYYQTEAGQSLIKKISENRSGKSYEEQYGIEKALEIKNKIRENKLVEMNKPEVKQNLREQLVGKTNVERYGEAKAAEVKQKQSLSRKGKYTGKHSSRHKSIENIQLQSPDGTIYNRIEGIKEFAEKHGLSKNHLSELLSGKRKTHHGWSLVNIKVIVHDGRS